MSGIHRGVVFAVALAVCIDYMLLAAVIPILPLFLKEDFTYFDIALVFSSKPLFQLISNPFMGWLVDKCGPKRPLVLGMIVLAISTALFGFALTLDSHDAYWLLFSARSVQGVGSASIMGSGMALVTLTHSKEGRGGALGMAMTGVAVGVLLGPSLGGVLGSVDLYLPFLVLAGLLFVEVFALPLLAFRQPYHNLEDEGTENISEEKNSFKLFVDPSVLAVATATLLSNFSIGFLDPLFPLYLIASFSSITQSEIGLIYTTSTVCYLICTPAAGFLSDKYPKHILLCLGLLLVSLSMGAFYLGRTGSWPFIFTGLALSGCAAGFTDTPALPLLAEIVEKRDQSAFGMVYSVQDSALSLGFMLGPLVAAGAQLKVEEILPSSDPGQSFRTTTALYGCFSLVFLLPVFCILRRDFTRASVKSPEQHKDSMDEPMLAFSQSRTDSDT